MGGVNNRETIMFDIDDVADTIDDLASELKCEVNQIIDALLTAELIDEERAGELKTAMGTD